MIGTGSSAPGRRSNGSVDHHDDNDHDDDDHHAHHTDDHDDNHDQHSGFVGVRRCRPRGRRHHQLERKWDRHRQWDQHRHRHRVWDRQWKLYRAARRREHTPVGGTAVTPRTPVNPAAGDGSTGNTRQQRATQGVTAGARGTPATAAAGDGNGGRWPPPPGTTWCH